MGLAGCLLLVGLALRGVLAQAVSVELFGRIRMDSPSARPEVEVWFPQPRIFVDSRGRFYRRDSNGRLNLLESDFGSCGVEWSGDGTLRVGLSLRCTPPPGHCTLSVRRQGYVTRYARLIVLSGRWASLRGQIPSLGPEIRRVSSKEELFKQKGSLGK